MAFEWHKHVGGLNQLETMQAKLESCSKGLKKWSRHIGQDRLKAIKEKSKAINLLQRD